MCKIGRHKDMKCQGNRWEYRPAGKPNCKETDAAMFIPLTRRSDIIGRTESCMPMNQPFRANSDNVAGAAQMRM